MSSLPAVTFPVDGLQVRVVEFFKQGAFGRVYLTSADELLVKVAEPSDEVLDSLNLNDYRDQARVRYEALVARALPRDYELECLPWVKSQARLPDGADAPCYLMRRARGEPLTAQALNPGRENVGTALGIVAAYRKLHSLGVVQVDVKLDNIIRLPNRDVRLIDVDGGALRGGFVPMGEVSDAFAAPEIYTHGVRPEDFEGHVIAEEWAVAILLYRLLVDKKGPFPIAGVEEPYPNNYIARLDGQRSQWPRRFQRELMADRGITRSIFEEFARTFTSGSPTDRTDLTGWQRVLRAWESGVEKELVQRRPLSSAGGVPRAQTQSVATGLVASPGAARRQVQAALRSAGARAPAPQYLTPRNPASQQITGTPQAGASVAPKRFVALAAIGLLGLGLGVVAIRGMVGKLEPTGGTESTSIGPPIPPLGPLPLGLRNYASRPFRVETWSFGGGAGIDLDLVSVAVRPNETVVTFRALGGPRPDLLLFEPPRPETPRLDMFGMPIREDFEELQIIDNNGVKQYSLGGFEGGSQSKFNRFNLVRRINIQPGEAVRLMARFPTLSSSASSITFVSPHLNGWQSEWRVSDIPLRDVEIIAEKSRPLEPSQPPPASEERGESSVVREAPPSSDERAESSVPREVDITSESADSFINRAEALFQQQRYEEAKAACRQALAIDPSNGRARDLAHAIDRAVEVLSQ